MTNKVPLCALKACVTRRRGRPSRHAHAMPREEILQRAFAAFARDGYDGVSLRALAGECQVSDSLLTHHFGSKQQLWYEAVDSVYAPIYARLMSLLDTLAPSRDAATTLQTNLPQALKLMAAHPVAISFLFREGEGDDERGEYIRATYIRPYLARIDGLFRQAQDDGHFRRISFASRHVLVFGLMRSLVMPGVLCNELAPHLATPETINAYIDEAIGIFYDGLVLSPDRKYSRAGTGAAS